MKNHYLLYKDYAGHQELTCDSCGERIVPIIAGTSSLAIRLGQLEHQMEIVMKALDNKKTNR